MSGSGEKGRCPTSHSGERQTGLLRPQAPGPPSVSDPNTSSETAFLRGVVCLSHGAPARPTTTPERYSNFPKAFTWDSGEPVPTRRCCQENRPHWFRRVSPVQVASPATYRSVLLPETGVRGRPFVGVGPQAPLSDKPGESQVQGPHPSRSQTIPASLYRRDDHPLSAIPGSRPPRP